VAASSSTTREDLDALPQNLTSHLSPTHRRLTRIPPRYIPPLLPPTLSALPLRTRPPSPTPAPTRSTPLFTRAAHSLRRSAAVTSPPLLPPAQPSLKRAVPSLDTARRMERRYLATFEPQEE
jgi:hypothetical protein